MSCNDGEAEVELKENSECEECSAKLFCKPSSKDHKTLSVHDPLGVFPGDEVRISIPGSSVLRVSFLIYGAPLILLVISIFAGLQIFEHNLQKELLSFLSGIAITGIYFFIFSRFSSSKRNDFEKPKIDFVKKCDSIN